MGMHSGSDPPARPLLPTFLPFSVTSYSLLQSNGCHIMSLLMSPLLFLSDTAVFSQGGPISASACQNHSGGLFSEGDTFV